MTETPDVGMLFDLPNDEYHRVDAVSKSRLWDFMVCPANYWGKHEDPMRPAQEQTIGQRRGTALHTFLLEPDEIRNRYVQGPDVSRNTKEWKAFVASQPPGVEALKPDEFVMAAAQAESLSSQPEISKILSRMRAEVSVFWIDKQTGLRCRCRPDGLAEFDEGIWLLDAKTGTPDPKTFVRTQVVRNGYDVQAAFYSEGVREATGKPVLGFIFGVVGDQWPYLSSAIQLGSRTMESGFLKFRKALNQFADCREHNTWPGFDDLYVLDVPNYALDTEED